MKYLVALLLVFALIAKYEQQRIKIKCRNGRCKGKIRDGWFTRAEKFEFSARAARDVDHIDEDLDKRETAILTSGLQSLLQQVVEKRVKAGDTDDTEYV